MAGVCLLAFIAGLLLETYGLPVEIKEKDKEAVFVSQQAADTVLRRLRRYNSGRLEEVLQKDNLERECKEETCTLEEAREVFEDNDKTVEQFSCGRFDTPASSATSSITPQSTNSNSTLDDDYEEDLSQAYDFDYNEFLAEDSDLSNISMAVKHRSVRSP
ncbi:Coagulation factor IX [Liparis tanakae]|uniref:Coagulation factor IX n=1 Tax=Liparis tanakae TaxID=230148 RepID=A0A4Z2HEY4_9TELE|nr:Coagulation factor IX [Liparis tanakae]